MTGSSPTNRGFGIDVGGSGVKGGIVDLDTGQLIGDRFKLPTPQPSTPDAVAATIAKVVEHFDWTGPLGVTYPGVITHGVVRTAANVDKTWIGTDVNDVYSRALGGRPVTVLNDADAAGLAEQRFGAGMQLEPVQRLRAGIGFAPGADADVSLHQIQARHLQVQRAQAHQHARRRAPMTGQRAMQGHRLRSDLHAAGRPQAPRAAQRIGQVAVAAAQAGDGLRRSLDHLVEQAHRARVRNARGNPRPALAGGLLPGRHAGLTSTRSACPGRAASASDARWPVATAWSRGHSENGGRF